jgi:DNA-binding transcriptional regulator YbjK
MEVIVRSGIEGLSHRAIAAAANVPLGSTTYYFESLDDILLSATLRAMADDEASLSAWAEAITHEADLAPALAQRIIDDAHRSQMVANIRLYFAAATRPELEEIAYKWSNVMTHVLERFVDEVTAEVLSALYDALIIRTMISGDRVDQNEVERVIRRVIE